MATSRSRKISPQVRCLHDLTRGVRAANLSANSQSTTLYAVKIDGDLARRILEHCNGRNRKIRQRKVEQFTRQMENGEWRLQQSLIFTDEGELIDGQHRLKAVEDANKEIPFLVQLVPDSTAAKVNEVIDAGTPRNVADYLHFNGVWNAARIAPLLKYERNFRITKSPFQRTESEKPDYLRLFHQIGQAYFDKLFEVVPRGLHAHLKVQRAIVDWLGLQLCKIDVSEAEVFLGALADPAGLGAKEPALVAERALVSMAADRASNKTKTGVPPVEACVMLVKSWNLYYRQADATKSLIRYRPKDDFPIIEGLVKS